MSDGSDAQALQVLRSQAWRDRVVYVVVGNAASYCLRPRLGSQPPRSMKGVLTARRPLCGAFNPHIDLVAERYKVDRLG